MTGFRSISLHRLLSIYLAYVTLTKTVHYSDANQPCAVIRTDTAVSGSANPLNLTLPFSIDLTSCPNTINITLATVTIKKDKKPNPTLCQFIRSCSNSKDCTCKPYATRSYQYTVTKTLDSNSLEEVWIMAFQMSNGEQTSLEKTFNIEELLRKTTEAAVKTTTPLITTTISTSITTLAQASTPSLVISKSATLATHPMSTEESSSDTPSEAESGSDRMQYLNISIACGIVSVIAIMSYGL